MSNPEFEKQAVHVRRICYWSALFALGVTTALITVFVGAAALAGRDETGALLAVSPYAPVFLITGTALGVSAYRSRQVDFEVRLADSISRGLTALVVVVSAACYILYWLTADF